MWYNLLIRCTILKIFSYAFFTLKNLSSRLLSLSCGSKNVGDQRSTLHNESIRSVPPLTWKAQFSYQTSRWIDGCYCQTLSLRWILLPFSQIAYVWLNVGLVWACLACGAVFYLLHTDTEQWPLPDCFRRQNKYLLFCKNSLKTSQLHCTAN